MKKTINILIAVLIVSGFIYIGLHNIVTAHQDIKLKEIQLQDASAKLKQLNQDYNNLLKEKNVDKVKLKELEEQKKKLESDLQAKLDRQEKEKIAIQNATRLSSVVSAASSDKQTLMSMAGISPSDYTFVDYILTKESGWRVNAVNRSSGATGLCQSLPASKMASSGSDYLTNPITQLKWCNGYAIGRYGSWSNAYNFWLANHWW